MRFDPACVGRHEARDAQDLNRERAPWVRDQVESETTRNLFQEKRSRRIQLSGFAASYQCDVVEVMTAKALVKQSVLNKDLVATILREYKITHAEARQ